MAIRERLTSVRRRIRRWCAARWHQMGLRLFPRVHDTILDRAPGPGNVFTIVHRHDGLDEVVNESTQFGEAIMAWAAALGKHAEYPGELQFWKNGKLRDSREALS